MPAQRAASIVAVALAALASASATAARDDMAPGDVGAGRDYARRVCSECHRVEPSKDIVAIIRPTDFEMIANLKGVTAISLNAFLVTPHAKMPNLIVPPEDRANVVAYILSLRSR